MISLHAEVCSEEEPEAGDVVVEHLGALLLLEKVGGQQPQLHDHPRQSGRDFTLQEKETALKKRVQKSEQLSGLPLHRRPFHGREDALWKWGQANT